MEAGEPLDMMKEENVFAAKGEDDSEAPSLGEKEASEEILIGDFRIKINFPEEMMNQSCLSSREQRFKLAGTVAAKALQGNPQLLASPLIDPVPIWQEIRDFVLERMNRSG